MTETERDTDTHTHKENEMMETGREVGGKKHCTDTDKMSETEKSSQRQICQTRRQRPRQR